MLFPEVAAMEYAPSPAEIHSDSCILSPSYLIAKVATFHEKSGFGDGRTPLKESSGMSL